MRIFCESLEELADAVSTNNVAHLAASIASLQLMPENADCLTRLEILSHVVASVTPTGSERRLRSGDIGRLCNTGVIGESVYAHQDDPCNEMFTSEVPFYGGTFRVFPGTTEYASETLTALISAIFRPGSPLAKCKFYTPAYRLLRSGLIISEAVAARARLPRGLEPIHSEPHRVIVPLGERSETLRRAVCFSSAELDTLLATVQMTRADLLSIVRKPGNFSPEWNPDKNAPLTVRPLVDYGSETVVLVPGLILPALCHAVVLFAQASGEKDALLAELANVTWNEAVRSLDFMGCAPLDLGSETPENIVQPLANLRGGFFRVDQDRALFALVITEDFRAYDERTPFGHWVMDHLEGQVKAQIENAQQHHDTTLTWSKKLFVLVLIRTLGRSALMSLEETAEEGSYDLLDLTTPELSVLSHCFARNGISLWKFAKAVRRLQRKAAVVSFSKLDLYRLYQKHQFSFYLGDGAFPDMVNLDPGMSGEVRREVHRRTDPHFALSADRQTYHEVLLFRGDVRLPLYAAPRPMRDEVAVLVKGMPVSVWVTSPDTVPLSAGIRQVYASLVDAVAYTLWRVAPSIKPLLEHLRGRYPNLHVELLLPPQENWETMTPASSPAGGAPIEYQISPDWGAVRLIIHSSFLELAATPDNEGERELARVMLHAIASLAPDEDASALVSPSRAVDLHLPRGQQKMAILPRTHASFLLDDRDLPPYRPIQEADIEFVLDELGDHLCTNGMKRGRVPNEDQNKFLNQEVVGWLFSQFQELFSKLSSGGLLEELVGHHEAILRQQEFLKLTAPTRLACFDFDSELRPQVQKEMYAADMAAMAHRFLIEYAVAQPPAGSDVLSTATYDRLMALSRQIIYYGVASDFIHFGLGDLEYALLPSGRLGEDRVKMERTWSTFLRYFGVRRVRTAERTFGQYWDADEERSAEDAALLLTEENAAMVAEFGFSLQETSELYHWLVGEGVSTGRTVLLVDELVGRFAQSVGWEMARARELVNLMSLEPRSNFLSPPNCYGKHDLWPWRFNRRISYLRRPILIRQTDDVSEAIWGMRHTFKAGEYLVRQLTDGRLPPARGEKMTETMKRYQSRVNGERGKEFERNVIAAINETKGLRVQGSIKRIGSVDVGAAGEIDAVVANSARRTLFVLECKDLSFAKTAYEIGQQITQLHSSDPSHKTATRQARDKAEWVRSHLDAVLDFLQVDTKGKAGKGWQVRPIVVTDQRLMTSSFVESTVPILALDDLMTTLSR